jgi:hypothetical protein
MIDPLNSFDWHSLHDKYDARCPQFDKSSPHLDVFGSERPPTDRATYYRLIAAFAENRGAWGNQAIAFYEAMLYWKLYSQGQKNPLIWQHFERSGSLRQAAQERFSLLLQHLPTSLKRSPEAIVEAIKLIGDFQIPGMKSATALPVRTTFLHFVYPSVVPIFDKMVLQAVGVRETNANQKISVFKNYLPFAWELADRYTHTATVFDNESDVRVIDMALWVGRGN